MAEPKTKLTGASVPKFLATIEDAQVRKDCKAIAEIMAKATGKKAEMWGTSIVGFGRLTYRGRSGSTEWMEVAFAPRKGMITLYLTGGLQSFDLSKLGKHKTGKGCLYIKRLSDVDLPTLKAIVRASVTGARLMAAMRL